MHSLFLLLIPPAPELPTRLPTPPVIEIDDEIPATIRPTRENPLKDFRPVYPPGFFPPGLGPHC